jgi:hypothetical protein
MLLLMILAIFIILNTELLANLAVVFAWAVCFLYLFFFYEDKVGDD